MQHAVLVAVAETLGTHHHAQVGHAFLFEKIKLFAQAFLAGFALRSQQPSVPIIGSNVAVWQTVKGKLLTLHAHKPRLLRMRRAASHYQGYQQPNQANESVHGSAVQARKPFPAGFKEGRKVRVLPAEILLNTTVGSYF